MRRHKPVAFCGHQGVRLNSARASLRGEEVVYRQGVAQQAPNQVTAITRARGCRVGREASSRPSQKRRPSPRVATRYVALDTLGRLRQSRLDARILAALRLLEDHVRPSCYAYTPSRIKIW